MIAWLLRVIFSGVRRGALFCCWLDLVGRGFGVGDKLVRSDDLLSSDRLWDRLQDLSNGCGWVGFDDAFSGLSQFMDSILPKTM